MKKNILPITPNENKSFHIFHNDEFGNLRVIIKNGELWFVAKDVCAAIGTSPSHIANILDEDDRGYDTCYTPGGYQKMTVISEFGLYSIVFRSRKPQAKEFKRWIKNYVIPDVVHNICGTDNFLNKLLSNPDWAIGELHKMKEEYAVNYNQDKPVHHKAQIDNRQETADIASKSAEYTHTENSKEEYSSLQTQSYKEMANDTIRDYDESKYLSVSEIPWLKDHFVLDSETLKQIDSWLYNKSIEMNLPIVHKYIPVQSK